MTENMICPKCRGAMEVGFILDNSYGVRLVSSWVEGTPERSTFLGIQQAGSAKIQKKRSIETSTHRCTECGYLESYARE
jgi:predicted nucleic-acid-binding Zn-ribbon protein